MRRASPLLLGLALSACTARPLDPSRLASEEARVVAERESIVRAVTPAPKAAPVSALPSGGPALVRRNPQRARALVVTEAQALERLKAATPKSAKDYAALLRRTADTYSELAAASLGDARAAEEKADSAGASQALKVHDSAAKRAIALLRELADVPGADSAQALYLLGVEHLRNDDAAESRKALFEVASKHKDSPYASDAYLLFGELFALESATDPAKSELALQAFREVIKRGKEGNTAYCYALFREGEILVDRKQSYGVQSVQKALACVDEVPKATGKSIILAQADGLVRRAGGAALSAPAPEAPSAPAPTAPVAAAPAAATQAPTAPVAVGNEPRTALVIGNGSYDTSPLANPPRDARLVANTLRQVGFDVDLRIDADQAQMKRAIADLGAKLAKGGVGFFYYAGHGMQVNGVNYLVPVRAKIQREQDVDIEAVALGRLLAEMDKARNRVNVVALDACRDNPFARSFRSGSRGLALSDAPMGTLISFATAPGSVASDGDGQNSPYSTALAHNITRRGVPVEEVFKGVRREVKHATSQHQTPWESSSLEGDFSFVP